MRRAAQTRGPGAIAQQYDSRRNGVDPFRDSNFILALKEMLGMELRPRRLGGKPYLPGVWQICQGADVE